MILHHLNTKRCSLFAQNLFLTNKIILYRPRKETATLVKIKILKYFGAQFDLAVTHEFAFLAPHI